LKAIAMKRRQEAEEMQGLFDGEMKKLEEFEQAAGGKEEMHKAIFLLKREFEDLGWEVQKTNQEI